ncbi:Disease resistance-like protein DSC1 [Citrus sinensis]|uniref:Disease resistance-like protein DSC1 n=1 Tax=Citrus sinensis TaxID=2711 RepID=A0ACB8HY14_CITSI|nr:Disease resistance-like protein DSC1 [Citrus sinensis]
MHRLRFFKFYNSISGENRCKVHHVRSMESLFNEQRYFHWDGYPLKTLPSKISPEHLVSLEMPNSNIEQLWNDVQNLVVLKRLNLSYFKQLSRIPDLSLALNLEELNLAGCTSLFEIHSSIQHLNKLEELPSSIGNLSRLVTLDLRKCLRLKKVSSSLCNLKSLESLYLSGCLKLEKLPEEIGNLGSLKNMVANEIAISQVPSSISCLNRVELLSFAGCKGRPPQMGLKLPILFQSQILENLSLINCNIIELPESLGQLPSLKYLNLEENNFEKIPSNIKQVSKLSLLILDNWKRFLSLPELPCGSSVYARHCTSLETLSNLSTLFKPLCQKFDFCNCFKLNRNEVREIVEEALKKIQEDDHHPPRGSIWYPGSEIPEWFSFQSMGSSVTLELPPGWFYNNFVGFALCAIFPEFRGDTRNLLVDSEFKLKTKDGDWHVATYLLFVWNEDFGVNSSLESDHVLLGYDFSMDLDGLGGSDKACIQFYIGNYLDKRTEGFDVKKCGAHLIYAQDPSKRLRSKVEDDQVL